MLACWILSHFLFCFLSHSPVVLLFFALSVLYIELQRCSGHSGFLDRDLERRVGYGATWLSDTCNYRYCGVEDSAGRVEVVLATRRSVCAVRVRGVVFRRLLCSGVCNII